MATKAVPAKMGVKRGAAVTSARLVGELPAGITVEKMGKVRCVAARASHNGDVASSPFLRI